VVAGINQSAGLLAKSTISCQNSDMKYDWLLFDADGTLFDYDLSEQKALQQTFIDLELAFEAHCIPIYRKINQQIWQDFENGRISAEDLRFERFKRLFQELQISTNTSSFSQQYLRNLSQGLT
jgi:2-haloacid dehalogenase